MTMQCQRIERCKKDELVLTRNRKGMTLIELIIVMALLVLVIGTAFSMLLFGNKVFAKSVQEFDIQSQARLAVENTTKIVRYASALFTIPESSFRQDNLDTGWNYIGVHRVVIRPAAGGNPAVMGSELAIFRYDVATGTHQKTVLMPASEEMDYRVRFHKQNPHHVDNLIQYTVDIIPKGSVDAHGLPKPSITLTSELESLNALQIIDQGSAGDPAVALAYREEERPTHVVGHIAMVLDNSGSMDWGMNGNTNVANASKRITILKNEATALVNGFATEDNISISLVPFSTSANNPKAFRNVRSQTASLLSDISAMTAVGGTNTGDGLRRAYWQLKNRETTVPSGVRIRNYVIVLVDGVTTFATVKTRYDHTFLADDGNVANTDRVSDGGQIIGDGAELDPNGTAYVTLMGGKLAAADFARSYVIGFSARTSDLNSVNDIASACGAPASRVFQAGDSAQLSQILTAIRQDIVNDIWYLQGPGL